METNVDEKPARGVREIVSDLQHEFGLFLRSEVALAKSEWSEKTETYRTNVRNAAIGGVVAHMGALLIMAGLAFVLYRTFVTLGMADVTAMWAAPLVLGLVVALIGGLMLKKALHNLKQEGLTPERSLHSLKEDKQWARRKVA